MREDVEIVAEFTTNHMGHFGLLCRMLVSASGVGADAVKMQKKDVDSFYTRSKLNSKFESPFGHTYSDYRSMFEFTIDEFKSFDTLCSTLSIPWFCTVQDISSLEFIAENFNPRRIKIASRNAKSNSLLPRIFSTFDEDVEIVISVAGLTLSEIANSLDMLHKFKRIYLLHCVAEYPCPVENLRLGNIPILIDKFGGGKIKIGYSGHEVGFLPSLAAVDLGAVMLERHFCISRSSFVHHIECSLEPNEFKSMCDIIRNVPDLSVLYENHLPRSAFSSEFKMSECESKFLLHDTYATDLLGNQVNVKRRYEGGGD